MHHLQWNRHHQGWRGTDAEGKLSSVASDEAVESCAYPWFEKEGEPSSFDSSLTKIKSFVPFFHVFELSIIFIPINSRIEENIVNQMFLQAMTHIYSIDKGRMVNIFKKVTSLRQNFCKTWQNRQTHKFWHPLLFFPVLILIFLNSSMQNFHKI